MMIFKFGEIKFRDLDCHEIEENRILIKQVIVRHRKYFYLVIKKFKIPFTNIFLFSSSVKTKRRYFAGFEDGWETCYEKIYFLSYEEAVKLKKLVMRKLVKFKN